MKSNCLCKVLISASNVLRDGPFLGAFVFSYLAFFFLVVDNLCMNVFKVKHRTCLVESIQLVSLWLTFENFLQQFLLYRNFFL